ncbi:hypothetical protein ACFQZE_05600 [Paenibacillus sp. GCM10027627]|uniref:hypothetical protein n=1 Tax=unclassified Paenibacillus TaxID=185978 RepID=UPI0036302E63
MESKERFERARTFIYENARLIDRKRFAYLFEGGKAEDVWSALGSYQNKDGGIGHAFEPDIRCPQSQPVPTEMALHVMDETGRFDPHLMSGILSYLKSITLPDGGFPFAFRSLMEYPHAPWWKTEDDGAPSINPTGNILGLLLKNGYLAELSEEEWFSKSMKFMWKAMLESELNGYHDGIQWIHFLQFAPETEHTTELKGKLDEWLASPGVIERNPHAEGYVHKVLDWITDEGSYAIKFVAPEELNAHLDELVLQQQEDGGWPISFPAVSRLGELEWRGAVTVERLKTLKAFGKM